VVVERLEKECGQTAEDLHQPSGDSRGGEAQQEVLVCPRQAIPGPQTAPLLILSIGGEAAVAQVTKPHEIISTAMNLLHERGLGVHEPLRPSTRMHLSNAAMGIDDMLEDGL